MPRCEFIRAASDQECARGGGAAMGDCALHRTILKVRQRLSCDVVDIVMDGASDDEVKRSGVRDSGWLMESVAW